MRHLLLLSLLVWPWLAAATPLPSQSPIEACRGAISQAEREYGIPPGLLHAIGRVESGRRDPATGESGSWPWAINAEGQGRFLPGREAAVAAVRELQGRGVRLIDVGCMQVNLHHHPRAFASLEEAFEPLANARYAARYLIELQAAAGDWLVAAGRYHSHTPQLGEAYRARVAAAWPAGRDRAQRPPQATTMAGAGGQGLSNGADRAQILASAGGAGRGLDAYRNLPVPLASRSFAWVAGGNPRR
jgi:hypothetical protein